MPASLVRVLIIEDNLAEARLLQELLRGAKSKQFHFVHVKRLQEALNSLRQEDFDVILLDLTLPDSQGLSSLPTLICQAPSVPIVVLTNTNDDELAIAAVRQGAQDYLVKRQVNGELLMRSLLYAIERQHMDEILRQTNQLLTVQVQERTQELVKAQELNQLKSEFVSMLSHDFRNPLNSILLSTGLLQNHPDQLSDEKKLTHFQRIRSSINKLAHLLDEVSMLGKAESGQLPSHLAPLNLEDFCRSLIEELQMSATEKHQLLFTTRGGVPEALWDESVLHHILSNLLANAVKYSPKGGLIWFELVGQASAVIFRIQDQGIGIPAADQPDLFQPFHRASNVDGLPGTGLGLAIARKCVEICEGAIAVDSQEGIGTTFIVTLPIRPIEP
jgi:signal transduction histidine kinase